MFADKVLRDKAFNIAKDPKYNGYQRSLASMVYKVFDKKTSGKGIKNENISNKELAEELYKTFFKKVMKRKLPFIDNIWGADLANMQLIFKVNKGFRFSLCVMDIYSKYARAIPLKEKKCITNTNSFQKIFDEANRKPNKIWVDEGNGFSTHNEGKSLVTERFIRISKKN